jgi:Pyruvate-formate lyase-activating enzyme
MRIAGIRKTSLFDGYGVNYVVFCQGCTHQCKDCQNPSTWDSDGGYEVTIEELQQDILDTPLVSGVTFSGGDPVEQLWKVRELAEWCKGQGLQTTLYTGYILANHGAFVSFNRQFYKSGIVFPVFTARVFDITTECLQCFDYIIDGPYDCTKKSLDIPFRGSSNQRILKKGVDY